MRAPDRRLRRRWLLGTGLTVLLALGAVVGAPWLYARFVVPPAAPPLALTAPSTPAGAPAPPELVVDGPDDLEGAWTVADGSEAGYRVGEVLSGRPVTVVGRTPEVTGSAEVEDGRLVAAEVVVEAGTVATDDPARDAYARRALDTGAFPEATFVLAEPVDVTALADDGAVSTEAEGTLTLHGTEVAVTADLRAQLTRTGVEVVARVPLTFERIGLRAPDLAFVTVEPDVLVEARLVLTR